MSRSAANNVPSILAVAAKDIRSELRTRYGVTTLGLFVVTTVILVVFALADEPIRKPIAAALLWVIMFYTAMTGLGRAFVSEEERGTALFLRLQAPPLSIYFGKLLVNTALALASNLLATFMVLLFISSVVVGDWTVLLTAVSVGSIGLASVLTIVSAIVAKAGTRNPVLPVLSFPMLVPLVMPGVNAMLMAFGGLGFADAQGDLLLMVAYTGIVIVVSSLVFEFIWAE